MHRGRFARLGLFLATPVEFLDQPLRRPDGIALGIARCGIARTGTLLDTVIAATALDLDFGDDALYVIDVTRGSDHHPYLQAWWPASHGLGYEHSFVNQAADMLAVLAGASPVVPLPDFEDALRTQQVLHAAILSARNHAPVAVPSHAQEAC